MTTLVQYASRLALLAVTELSLGNAVHAHGPDPTPPVRWALPYGAELVATALDGERLELYVTLPSPRVDERLIEEVVRGALEDAYEAGATVSGVVPYAAHEGRWVPMPALLPAPPAIPRKAYEDDPGRAAAMRSAVATAAGARRQGALSGKVVYVSAGHGFTWDPALDRWATQRGNTHDIVEDLVSAETIDQLLTTYLENAGATVFTVRERDMNPDMVIVDAGAGGASQSEGEGSYREAGAWSDSTSGGFRLGLAPYKDGENPFAGGASRVAAIAASATATATFSFEVPEAGDYRVYGAWVAGSNRAPDAHYAIVHAGGTSHMRVDQRRHGGTWVSLGRYRFESGVTYRVELHNDSASAGSFVSADAIRVGGGMGDAARGAGGAAPRGTLSGRPRWEENARYHVQFSGAPSSVYAYTGDERSDDVGARSRYAAWQNEAGEDAVYVAWHTNAPNPGVGTSTFVYGPNEPDGTYNFTGTEGSDRLGRLLHDEVVNDLQAAIDPAWRDRGFYTAYFGELNKNHNPEMPAALCEVAFHSTASDAAQLKQPKVRQVAARAFTQAIVRYFAERDGQPTVFAPEPPERFRVALSGTTATLRWAAPQVDAQDLGGHAATGYRVYRSRDGRAFDDGVEVTGTSHVVHDLVPGEPAYFRVSATNAGGESMPSVVLAINAACEGRPDALLVHAFYRLDGASAPREDLSVFDLGTVVRVRLAEMNRFDATVGHAEALAAAGIAFEAAEATALPELALDHRLIDWVLGEESTADETFSDAEQQQITSWLAGGDGRTLITSGAELAWDLGEKGSESDQGFLARLGVGFAGDDAGTYTLSGAGRELALDDGTLGTYHVAFPDVLAPVAGATPVLEYEGGAVAGVRYEQAATTALTFGVPLESLFPVEARAALVAGLLEDVELARVPSSGCGLVADPGPEIVEGVEPVEVVEPADVVEGADATSDTSGQDGSPTPDGGATPGRPSREASATTRVVDGGCVSGSAGSFVSSLAALGAWLALARRRRREAR